MYFSLFRFFHVSFALVIIVAIAVCISLHLPHDDISAICHKKPQFTAKRCIFTAKRLKTQQFAAIRRETRQNAAKRRKTLQNAAKRFTAKHQNLMQNAAICCKMPQNAHRKLTQFTTIYHNSP